MVYYIVICIAFIIGTLCYLVDEVITEAHILKEWRNIHWETVLNIKIWLSIAIILCAAIMFTTGIIGAIIGIFS